MVEMAQQGQAEFEALYNAYVEKEWQLKLVGGWACCCYTVAATPHAAARLLLLHARLLHNLLLWTVLLHNALLPAAPCCSLRRVQSRPATAS